MSACWKYFSHLLWLKIYMCCNWPYFSFLVNYNYAQDQFFFWYQIQSMLSSFIYILMSKRNWLSKIVSQEMNNSK